MNDPKPSRRLLLIVPVVAIAAIAFVGGQALPQIVPQSWAIGHKSLDFNELNDTYELLQQKFDGNVDQNKVMDGAKAGVVSAAGDPYTTYLDATAAKALDDQLSGTLSGIGAEIAIRNNKLTVVSPIVGSPAEKAGIQPGDYVAEIDGKSSSGYTLDEAVSKIRGNAGTKVKLTLIRGSNDPINLEITRETITVPSVTWSMKDNNVGYINITQFGTDTSAKTDQAAAELKAKGATRIVLDLRNDPGGYLDAAVDVSSQFVPEGKTVVEERRKGKTSSKLSSRGSGSLEGLPVAVLINGGSASASEIVAGALKDDVNAKLIGETSFGKGSVQEVTKLSGGAEVKITVAHWFTPSGRGIDKQGIKPDIEVKRTQDDLNANRDPQLDRALQELK